MSVGSVAVTIGFLTVTTGLSYRNCNLARPLMCVVDFLLIVVGVQVQFRFLSPPRFRSAAPAPPIIHVVSPIQRALYY